jgi:hypothetical protein
MSLGTTHSPNELRAGELRLDRLLGRQVLARNNQPAGRLEEVRAGAHGTGWTVIEYVIGAAGLLERLGIGVGLLFGRTPKSYVARWDQLDVSDPEKPRLTCPIAELRKA